MSMNLRPREHNLPTSVDMNEGTDYRMTATLNRKDTAHLR